MHPKRGPPLLYHPGVAPLVLPCELVFGVKLISLISSDIFIMRREKVLRVVKTCGGRGSTQPHCQPRRPSTQVTGPEMNNNNNNHNHNNNLVVGLEPAFVVISPRLQLRQEKVKLASCTSGCLESCDFPSGV